MQPGRGDPHQEAQVLLRLRLAGEAEILLEGHAPGQEGEEAHPHANGRRGHGRDAALGTAGKDGGADGQREEVEPVHEQVHAIQEGIDVAGLHAVGEQGEVQRGVDGAGHLRQHLHLGPAQRGHGGAGLAVHVLDAEAVEVGDVELPDAQPGQCQQMEAADTPEPGDGNAPGAQGQLLPLRGPAQVAAEGGGVVEGGSPPPRLRRLGPRKRRRRGAAFFRAIPRADCALRHVLAGQVMRRRRKPRPSSPTPNSAIEAGSGVCVGRKFTLPPP